MSFTKGCKLMLVLTCLCMGVSRATDTSVEVGKYRCTRTVSISDDDTVTISYDGDGLDRTCKITIETNDYTEQICASVERFDVSSSSRVELGYHKYSYSSSFPDEEYTYYNRPILYSEWCSSASTLIVSIKSEQYSPSADVVVKVYSKDDEVTASIVDGARTVVYVVIGTIVGLIILAVAITVVVCICCCRKRPGRGGTVYQPPANAQMTPGSYPMSQPVGQPMYQPPYQPAPNVAYPPPQTGYSEAPPAYSVGPPQGYVPDQSYPPAGMAQDIKPSAPQY